jgi:diacylglycerol kinase family enzyme
MLLMDAERPPHITLLYNPHANYWLTYGNAEATEAYLHELMAPLEVNYTLVALAEMPMNALEAQLKAFQTDALWVAGGDGSILAMATLAQKLDIPLGVLPAGTMNLLARDLGMSLDLSIAIQQLATAPVVRIDVASINQQPFLCISNVGLSTRFTQLREEMRHQPAWVRWPSIVWQMGHALFKYRNLRIDIEANGETLRLKTRAISIANNPLSNQGSLLPSRDTLDSGQLAIYVTKETTIWSMPRLYSRLMLGNWQHDPELLVIHTPEAVLRLPRRRSLKVMTDGELQTYRTPLRYSLSPRQLKVLRPFSDVQEDMGGT